MKRIFGFSKETDVEELLQAQREYKVAAQALIQVQRHTIEYLDKENARLYDRILNMQREYQSVVDYVQKLKDSHD